MNTTRSVLYVGLPASGKTTFLALLYRAIVANGAGPLQLGTYQDDREHVNDVAKRLARCEEALRTLTDHDEQLALSLSVEGEGMFLRIPDLSGERWSHVIEDRRWSVELDRAVAEATGFVLFVHSGGVDPDPLIDDVEHGASVGEAHDVVRTRGTQVALVDLIQLIARRRGPRALRLAIIASAWDLKPETLTPNEWLAEDLPLLDQFLAANASPIESDVWGVSAQGGDFSDPAQREELLRQDVVGRAIVIAGNGDECTIAAPMEWALRIT
jgi:hypothetical protein